MKKLLFLGLLLELAACSRSSSHEKLLKSLQTVQSWTATAQMVGETWQQGAVPDAYAEQTLKKSQEEIARETKDLTEPSAQKTQQIQETIQKLIAAVKHRQKGTIAAPLQQLSTQHQQLNTLLKAQEKQP